VWCGVPPPPPPTPPPPADDTFMKRQSRSRPTLTAQELLDAGPPRRRQSPTHAWGRTTESTWTRQTWDMKNEMCTASGRNKCSRRGDSNRIEYRFTYKSRRRPRSSPYIRYKYIEERGLSCHQQIMRNAINFCFFSRLYPSFNCPTQNSADAPRSSALLLYPFSATFHWVR
jgi:hypothetical protein